MTLKDVKDAAAQIAEGFAIYPGAHASGATVLHRPSPSGNEDFISFENRPSAPSVSYEVAVVAKVGGLRLVANTLELLDASGAPRLRVAPPYLIGADGERTDATLAVQGCAVDTSPAAPWGRPVTAPGGATCTVHVTWNDEAVAYPAVLDPRWTTTGSMTTARQGHTATLLSTGKVLVVGGTSNGSTALASAELFDRTTGTWAATGSMTGARTLHTAVQLGTNSNTTTSSKVLIAGGLNGSTSQSTAQLYSVTAGTWTAAANLNAARHGHTATLLASGNVLVAGGLNGTAVLNTAAVYNPASGTGTWTAVGNMASARRFHTATLLVSSNANFNNKVLVVGGNSTGTTSLTSVQLFDGTSAWSTQTALPSAREGQTATLLASGQVLITGGRSGSTTLNTTSLFNPPASGTTATWTSTGNLTIARQGHAATLLSTGILSSGQVLVTGGSNGTSSQSSGELWNGTAWTATGTAMAAPVQGHTATLMANGAVLIAGGINGSTTVAVAQLYDPSFALTCTSNSQCSTGFCVSGVCCDTACNGGCGACNLAGKVGTCSAVASGTTCRASAGACDAAETCNGTVLTCPADGFAPSTTVCRAAAGACDVAETCTGTSAVCPADGFAAAATVCRAAAGACDVAETCTGTGAACPADGFAPATTTCRAAAGTCDVAEKCTGTSAACPADGFLAAATVCRAAAGACDVAETCTGTGAACPADGFAPATTTCRVAAGTCDVAEKCTGTSAACPADALAPAATVCRAAAGACDVPETCTGAGAACPADVLAPSTTVCRASAGACDVAETCTGTSAACPADALAPASTVCRTATGGCDAAESCTGSSPACPADAKLPDNSFCTDGNLCTINDRCQGGVCVPGLNVTCPGDSCHAAGTCDPATGFCANAVPINEGGFCDDGNRCTVTSQCKLGVCVPEDPVTGCTAPGDPYYAPLTNLGSRQGVSVANDINNHGVVAGTDVHYTALHEFAPSGEGVGFSWTAEGGIHLLPRPAGKQVSTWAISDNGEIVGTAWPQEVASPGAWLYHYDPVTEQAQGSQTAGWGMGINATGQYTGTAVFDAQGYKTFRALGTTFQQIPIPSGFLGVNGRAIDAAGNIVGNFQRPDGNPSLVAMRYTDALGFEYLGQLLPASSDWDIDPVLGGDFLTSANGTNGTQIVGTGQSGNGKTRGFVLTPGPIGAPGSATIKRIDLPEGTTDDTAHVVSPYRINASGQVVGTLADISNGPQRAFIWTDGVGTIDLNKYVDPNSGWVLQSALGINDGVNGRPEVVGDGLFNGQKRAFKMTVPDLSPCPATACQGPGVRDLRTGLCPAAPVLADGTTCDDGNSCTPNDACQAGTCSGGPIDVVCAVQPSVEGVATLNGQQVAVFSYNNIANQNTNIPYGPQNFVTPPGSDANNPPASPPPAWFTPGEHRGAFTSPLVNGALSWTVGARTVTANGSSPVLTTETRPEGTGVDLGDGTFADLAPDPTPDIEAAILPTGATPDATDTAGKTDGSFSVTDDGAATYQIPLWVPDGMSGMQPHLGLAYNSRAGDGPLGIGWQISGLSSITRCHPDFARDGETAPITFTSDDKLCLDGERLVLFNQGPHMQDGAEYRTEHDRFIKIVQVGADAQGPTGFLVYYPDGTRSSFGYEPSPSRAGFHGGDPNAIVAGNRAIVTTDPNNADPINGTDVVVSYEPTAVRLSWALASSRDRYDNEVVYTYGNFGTGTLGSPVEYLPIRVEYNFVAGATHGDRAVEFDWGTSPRLDLRSSFVGGVAFQNSRLLRSIAMTGPDPVTPQLRSYQLGYRDATGMRAQLQSVKECDGNGVCKAPTTFQWTYIDSTFQRVPVNVAADTSGTSSLVPADVNGDGRDDLIFAGPVENQWSYALANADGTFAPAVVIPYDPLPGTQGSDLPSLDFSGRAADLDMDGKVDFLYPRVINEPTGESGAKLLRSTGNGFVAFETSDVELATAVGSRFNADYVGDFNGDGLPDIVRSITHLDTNGSYEAWGFRSNNPLTGLGPYQLLSWTSQGAAGSVLEVVPANAEWNAYAVDTDGDGKLELLFRDGVAGQSDQFNSVRMLALTQFTSGGNESPVQRTSLLGSGKFPGEVRYQMADVNGDGLADAIEIPNNGGNIRIAINNGRDFMRPQSFSLSAGQNVGQSSDTAVPQFSFGVNVDPGIRVMDYNYDGRADLFLMDAGCMNQNSAATLPNTPPTRSSPTALMLDGNGVLTSQSNPGVPIGNPVVPSGVEVGCPDYSRSRVLDVNGDGLADFVQFEGGGPNQIAVYLRKRDPAGPPNVLKTITDGLGHQTNVEYAPITDQNVHTPAQCSYPQSCNPRGMWVVSKQTMDATGIPATYVHQYQGARSDLQGIGWLGMDAHTIVDETDATGASELSTTTTYDHVNKLGSKIYAFSGKSSTVETVATFASGPDARTISTTTISRTTSQTYLPQILDGGARVIVLPDERDFTETETLATAGVQTSSQVNKTWKLVTNCNQQFGYVMSKGLVIGGDGGEEEDTQYQFLADNADQWLLGLRTQATLTYSTPGRTDIAGITIPAETRIRTTTYAPDPSTGALLSVTVEPSGDATENLTTQYFRNSRGQVNQVRETAVDPITGAPITRDIVTVDDFDASGIYPYHVRNALGQPSRLIYHAGLGVLVEAEDPNHLLLKRRYDGFGRLRGETRPDGASFDQIFQTISVGNFFGFMVNTQGGGGTNVVATYDQNGNELILDRRDENGGFNRTTSNYDAYGRLIARWRPYPLSAIGTEASLPHATYSYDILGRILTQDLLPSEKDCTHTNNKTNCSTRIDPGWGDPGSDKQFAQEESVVDQAGRLLERTEWVGQQGSVSETAHPVTTEYVYGPFGVLRDVFDTARNQTHVEYDDRGRRRTILDPDSGLETDTYDALDRLRRAISPGKSVQIGYDALDRRTSELTAESDPIASAFIWDQSPNGIGQLSSHSSPDGVSALFEYDTQGRPSAETWSAPGAGLPRRLDMGYDSFGRPQTITYPMIGALRYGVTFGYTGLSGELQTVSAVGGAILWQADTRNPERNILHETFGDGVLSTRGYETDRGYLQSIVTVNGSGSVQNLGFAYDAAGFMSARGNYIDGEQENFTHDELGRLTHWGGGFGGWSVDYQYDDLGNLSVRTSNQPGSSPEVKAFTTSGVNAGPHAVTSVTTNGMSEESYLYDPAGRQTNGPDRVVGYTDFDLPRTITKAGAMWSFQYDATHRRAVKRGPSGTTFYLGGLYEMRTTPGQPTTHVMYIPGESGVLAQATQIDGTNSPVIEYLHGDHLGSVNAVTRRDGPDSIATQMRFDPFGARIGTSNPPTNMSPPESPVADVTLGFTGHEEDDELGLINMNGRIYDPALSRFLTPDPIVSRPWRSQSFNRYSYAENSPLKFLDPSGFDDEEAEKSDKDNKAEGKEQDKGSQSSSSNGTDNAATTGARLGGDINGYIGNDAPGTHTVSIHDGQPSTASPSGTPSGTAPDQAGPSASSGRDDSPASDTVAPTVTVSADDSGPTQSPGPTAQGGNTSGQPLPPGANPDFGHLVMAPGSGVGHPLNPSKTPGRDALQGLAIGAAAGALAVGAVEVGGVALAHWWLAPVLGPPTAAGVNQLRTQAEILRDLFGHGVEGARAALEALETGNLQLIPPDLTLGHLQAYRDIAQRVVDKGDAFSGFMQQMLRLHIIELVEPVLRGGR